MHSNFIKGLKVLRQDNRKEFKLSSKVVFFSKPFFLCEIKEFLDEEYYQKLYNEFPPIELFEKSNSDKGLKKALDVRSKTIEIFLASNPIWREFTSGINTHKNSLFLKDLFHSRIPKRGVFKDRDWFTEVDYYTKKKVHIEGQRPKNVNLVRYSFEFSHLGNDAYIPPHTDSETKIITMIIYFPDPEVSWNGGCYGTYFYKSKKSNNALNSWDSVHLEGARLAWFRENYNILYYAKFEPNKLLIFLKSDKSWHEVKKLTKLKSTRKAFIINMFCR